MAGDEAVRARVESVLDMLDSHQFMSGVSANLTGRKLTGMGLVLGENGEVSKWIKTEDLPKKEDPLGSSASCCSNLRRILFAAAFFRFWSASSLWSLAILICPLRITPLILRMDNPRRRRADMPGAQRQPQPYQTSRLPPLPPGRLESR